MACGGDKGGRIRASDSDISINKPCKELFWDEESKIHYTLIYLTFIVNL